MQRDPLFDKLICLARSNILLIPDKNLTEASRNVLNKITQEYENRLSHYAKNQHALYKELDCSIFSLGSAFESTNSIPRYNFTMAPKEFNELPLIEYQNDELKESIFEPYDDTSQATTLTIEPILTDIISPEPQKKVTFSEPIKSILRPSPIEQVGGGVSKYGRMYLESNLNVTTARDLGAHFGITRTKGGPQLSKTYIIDTLLNNPTKYPPKLVKAQIKTRKYEFGASETYETENNPTTTEV